MRPEDEKNNLTGQEGVTPESEETTAAQEQAADDKAFEEGAAAADQTTSPDADENEEEYFSEKKPSKRKKRVRLKDMTPEQRRRYNIRAIVITSVVCGLVLVFFGICALAIEAVVKTVDRVKPDLVIVTGDMAYPVPFQAGTFNNKREAEMFASMMERLGVYWTITFGNHDTEIYSLYDRDEDIQPLRPRRDRGAGVYGQGELSALPLP